MRERLAREIMEIRPFNSSYKVNVAANVSQNGWHGAKDYANSSDFSKYLTTKADYMEYGGEYFKEHLTSNRYCPTPAPIVLNEPIPTNNDTSNASNSENTIEEKEVTPMITDDITAENDTNKMEEEVFVE